MAEQYRESVLLRRIRESDSPFPQPVTEDDLGSEFNFSGTIQLKRVRHTTSNSDTEDNLDDCEYVFDITGISGFNEV